MFNELTKKYKGYGRQTFRKPLVSVRRLLKKLFLTFLFPVLEIKLTFKMLAKVYHWIPPLAPLFIQILIRFETKDDRLFLFMRLLTVSISIYFIQRERHV